MVAIVFSVGLYFGLSQGQSFAAALQQPDPALAAIIDGPQRSEANKARDRYRHPLEVLTFFGVKADSNAIEVVAGKGWLLTEILAPYLKDRGCYTASGDAERDVAPLNTRISENPGLYGKTIITGFTGGDQEIAPPGSAGFVLTFRNIHNWMRAGTADAAFRAFYKALKPGGILGVEEHRGRPDQPQDPQAKSGYVRQDFAIALAEKAGFKLLGSSEVNANPKDYPEGVWTLPPAYRLKDQDRDKYSAIGESDRFVLKFAKPAEAK
ncbi:MAG: methyltransferase [Hyphomicrobiales bacterium]|nr:MAG: methyltransferase [Hyphomicrobiales bacterium]